MTSIGISFKAMRPFALIVALSLFSSTFTVSQEPPEGDALSPVLAELESSFQDRFVAQWYPRAVDREQGGYFSVLDANWEPQGPQDKFIVSQARHLWVTSQLAVFFEDDAYREMADHGFRFLKDSMWDAKNGGFRSLVSRTGEPIGDGDKTAYGNAFAIYALSSYYALSRDEEALELVKDAFLWMEKNSWDHEFGGYVDRLQAVGSWSGRSSEKFDTQPTDHIGLKDYN